MNHIIGSMDNPKVRRAAKQLWQYLQLNEQVNNADCLLVLGSRDDRVAAYAAELAKTYSFDSIIVSGGVSQKNDVGAKLWEDRTEAEHFADVMKRSGCAQPILLEMRATNTGQNFLYSYEMMLANKLRHDCVAVVTKPYMERRVKATFDVQWPELTTRLITTSPKIKFEHYFNDVQPFEKTVSVMVGDMDRIMKYPKLGYQSEQPVDEQATAAFEVLVGAGYTQYLL